MPLTADALESLLQMLRPAAAPLAIADLANQPHLASELLSWLAAEAHAVLLVPLIVDEKMAGLLGLARGQSGKPFLPGEVEIAATCANQAAMAISSARLYAQARQSQQAAQIQAAQFNLLTAAGEALSAAATPEAVVTVALAQLALALPYDSLLFYRYEEGHLRLLGSINRDGIAAPLGPTIAPESEPFIAATLPATAPFAVADAATDARFAAHASAAAPTPRSWLGIPVRQGSATLGAIVLARAEPDSYQAHHLELALALSGLIATALATAEQRTAAALAAAEERAAALKQAGQLQTELNEQAEHSGETQRQLDEYRALYEQNSQRADELAQRMREQEANLAHLETEHALAATSLEGQLRERTDALRQWSTRVAGLLKDRAELRPPVGLEHVLSQELLLGSRALAADAAVIYLSHADNGHLSSQAEIGLVETLPAMIAYEGGLVAAAVAARETVVVDDLLADARWGVQPAPVGWAGQRQRCQRRRSYRPQWLCAGEQRPG